MPTKVISIMVKEVDRDVWRAARSRAVGEGRTIRSVLVEAMRAYAFGTWAPAGSPDKPAQKRAK